MNRWGWLGLFSGIVLFSGCGAESASIGADGRVPARTPVPGDPSDRTPGLGIPGRTPSATPTPTPPPPTCPASGALVTVGPVEAALGHRAAVVKVTSCRSRTISVDHYPYVAVLNGRRHTMSVTVARGTSYMAIDPGATRMRLDKGESALAVISWSNTVKVAEDKASGTYLAIARRTGERPVVWPVDTDLGTTAKINLTAWCRKLPN